MKYLLTIFIFIFLCIGLSAQTKKDTVPPMTKQDSILLFNQRLKLATDSITTKTSMKDFQLWLDENVSAKSMREGTLNELWSMFVNTKLEEWARKNKIVVPKN